MKTNAVNFGIQLNKLNFIDAGLHDLPRIVATYNSTVVSRMVTADLDPVTVESRQAWFHAHNAQNRPLWLVYENETYMGWVSFQSFYGRPAYNKTAEISIYLETTARGKGLGQQCLQYALAQCPRLNITSLLGFIFGHNDASLRLFYSFGFEKWAHLPAVAELDGVARDLLILGKKV